MFERKSEPLLSRGAFLARMARTVAVVLGIVVFSHFSAVPVIITSVTCPGSTPCSMPP